ncbi:MAG: hypothetical protein ACYDEN_09575, partial [Acidimicrobiales bacterium]
MTVERLTGASVDERAGELVERAATIASGTLEGIEDAARELAAMTAGDLRVLERARRLALSRLETAPDHSSRQIAALLRRALEVGTWSWDAATPSPKK